MELWQYEDRRYRKTLRMKIGSLVGLGGSVISGIMGAGAAKDAANAQQTASQNAQNTLNGANSTVTQLYQPYTATGTNALKALNTNLTNGTGFATPFNFTADPGYQFALQQGQNAIQGTAAARGNLQSGGTLKALQTYGTGLADQTYNNAFNRYLQSSQLQFGQLSNLANLGLQGTTDTASSDLSTARGVSDLITGAGNAQAAGIIGAQNAYNGIFNGATSAANQYSLNNSLSKNPLSLFGQVL